MRNFAISVDWLQLYCRNLNPADILLSDLYSGYYKFELQEKSTRQFSQLWYVYTENEDLYAELQTNPYSSIIDKQGCILKINNRELYKPNYINNLLLFMETHNIQHKCISRLDVCYDCNTFITGQKPRRLINSFLSKKILKNNQCAYTLQGSSKLINDYSYIRFGSRSSSVCSYMYDKTKELREVKDKPYIRELWRINGIDENQEVWRIEISIRADMQNLICLENGDILRLSPDAITTQIQVEDVFYTYAKQYFSFKINDGTKNKTRMKDLKLFNRLTEITRKPMRITTASDTTRSDKIFLNKIESVKVELRDYDDVLSKALETVRSEFCLQKSLSGYYNNIVLPKKRRRK